MTDEELDIVDEEDRVIGRAFRSECHGNPELRHRVAHILVFNTRGDVLLQLRGRHKRIQPGKWDSSVGGHLARGEGYLEGALRELEEELGIREGRLERLHDYWWRTEVETERVRTYRLIHDGEVRFDPGEIEAVRFFSDDEVNEKLGTGIFTPNFEDEWRRLKEK